MLQLSPYRDVDVYIKLPLGYVRCFLTYSVFQAYDVQKHYYS